MQLILLHGRGRDEGGWGCGRASDALACTQPPRVPTEESTPPRGGRAPKTETCPPPTPAPAWPPSLVGELPSALDVGCPGVCPAALAGKTEPVWGVGCRGEGDVQGALAGVAVPSPEPWAALPREP